MITILIDHNIEGQGILLSGTFQSEGWSDLLPVRFARFRDVGLAPDSNDRVVWWFAQANGMILLTDNRNKRGANSLEQTLREESKPSSLPVLTIGSVDHMAERLYRERCVTRLAEILSELENYLGASRLFLP